uniref:non-specific serine/threonine protein kinase n=1 Tax=Leersia perrieri TaxID=77586 RepID=A0A0D9UW30_9ORYZ
MQYANFPFFVYSATSLVAAFVVLSFIMTTALYLSLKSRYNEEVHLKVEMFLRTYGTSKPTRYSFSDVKKIARRFKEQLGQGGFGSVYKGELPNGVPVAVKMLEHTTREGEEFINEVATIGQIHHINVVRLLGFCSEGTRHILIYEFMPNESLEKYIFLHDPNASQELAPNKMLDIAIGIARGMEYLHQGCNQRILHFDIKPHNILLDYNFNPKISDFGLAKLCARDQSIVTLTAARGTMGYIAPEIYSRNFGEISYKSDVYSFGMLVLEMVSGRRNSDPCIENQNEVYFPEWIYEKVITGQDFVLSREMTEEDRLKVRKMALVALWCIQWNPRNRPSMTKVVNMLTGRVQNIQVPPKPFVSCEKQAIKHVIVDCNRSGILKHGRIMLQSKLENDVPFLSNRAWYITISAFWFALLFFVSINPSTLRHKLILEIIVEIMSELTLAAGALLLSVCLLLGIADLQLQATALEDKDFFRYCPPVRCSKHGPEIRFPFRLESSDTPSACGLPCMKLSCSGHDTILDNRYLGSRFKVIAIDYSGAILTIIPLAEDSYSSSPCPLLKSENPYNYQPYPDPCDIYDSDYAILVSCSTEFAPSSISTATDYIAGPISCRSNKTHFSYLVLNSLPMSLIPSNCEAVSDGSIPIPSFFSSHVSSSFRKTAERIINFSETMVNWKTYLSIAADNCSRLCEQQGQRCAFSSQRNQTFCMHQGSSVKVIAATSSVAAFVVLSLMLATALYLSLKTRYNEEIHMKVEMFLKTVYKGELPNGVPVAVKMLENSEGEGDEFINEVATIGRIHHANIVRLLGFCSERTRCALIYEFMPNDSLEKCIFPHDSSTSQEVLVPNKMLDIALGIARGMEYLHQGCNQRILHFDIKPNNILMDYNFSPKISDFGLAKLCARDQSIVTLTAARGTMGYIAPELYSRNFGEISYKSDVYSFGMLVLEMVVGRRNSDPSVESQNESYLPERLYEQVTTGQNLELAREMTDEEKEKMRQLAIVALWCIQWNPKNRPSMTKVVNMLTGRFQNLRLSCSGKDTILDEKYSFLGRPYKVTAIDYKYTTLTIIPLAVAGLDSCPLLKSVPLHPLEFPYHHNANWSSCDIYNWDFAVLLSCSAELTPTRIPAIAAANAIAGPISCLSNSTHFSYLARYLVPTYLIPLDCEVVSNGPIPIPVFTSGNVYKFGESAERILNFADTTAYWRSYANPAVDNCSKCEEQGRRCAFSSQRNQTFCMRQGSRVKVIAATSSVATFVVLLSMVSTALCLSLRKRYNEEIHLKVEMFLKTYGASKPTRYTFSEVKKIARRFKVKLGQGGFGSVYRGELPNGVPVAVKMIEQSEGEGDEFINEVATIGRIHHANIVRLLGFCSEGTRRALIYEFMPNDSLEKHIFSHDSNASQELLVANKMLDIALGIARGMEYLHQGCNQRILHFDIKPHNILLDYNFSPKISDFGLAKLCARDQSIVTLTAARGTMGYIAPELYSRNFGDISYKSDVYSFGMLVLEMVSGRRESDPIIEIQNEVYFPEWIYEQVTTRNDLELSREMTQEEKETVRQLAIVALWCIQWNPRNRPSMTKVVNMLTGRFQNLQVPPKPFFVG